MMSFDYFWCRPTLTVGYEYLHDLFSVCEHLTTSRLVWSSCIGYPFAGGYSINYVYWCTPHTAADHLCIWQTWLSQLLPDRRDVCDLLTAACMTCHGATPSNKIRRESVLFFWPSAIRMERSPCWHPRRNLHSYLQEEILFLPGVWLHMTSFLCDNCNAPAFL